MHIEDVADLGATEPKKVQPSHQLFCVTPETIGGQWNSLHLWLCFKLLVGVFYCASKHQVHSICTLDFLTAGTKFGIEPTKVV